MKKNETIYKEVIVNGKKQKRWLKISLIEMRSYDENDNLIYTKDSNGLETWYEYDSDGNEIHCKQSDGFESWCEYDNHSRLIHETTLDDDSLETWYEYDINGNIYDYDSNGIECWIKCDRDGNEIYEKWSDGIKVWSEYDNNRKIIHRKGTDGIERWYDYNSDRRLIHYKEVKLETNEYGFDSYGKLHRCKVTNKIKKYVEEWYEYEVSDDGKMLKCITYKAL